MPVLNAILSMFVFLFFMHIASWICNCFFLIIVFIYNYSIICVNLWGLYVILVISVDVRLYSTGIALYIISTTNTTQNFTIA